MTTSEVQVPLCVDLDNTLVRTNTLLETIVGALRRDPRLVLQIPIWGLQGQAYLWSKLVPLFLPATQYLPYSDPVLNLIRKEAASGRPVILVTGAHLLVAQDVAGHLGLFSSVEATNGTVHLIQSRKAALLTEKFGEKGFDYVGDSWGDVAVFRKARRAYVVAADQRLAAHLERESIPVEWIPNGSSSIAALLPAMRPKQWAKNVLVFLPIILAHQFTDKTALIQSISAALLLCLASSSVYIFNDIADLEADRAHQTKWKRPFARGGISIGVGIFAGLFLAVTAVGLGLLLGPGVSLLLGAYMVVALLYSTWLKKLLIVDMVLLSCFYAARVFLGSVATGIPVSPWTALFCLLLFFALAGVKRYSELHNRAARASDSANRRAYSAEDAIPILCIGTSSFVGAIIALGLYLGSADAHGLYQRHSLLWLVCPILLGWSSRLWILAHRGELKDEDPVAFALRDSWSRGAAILCAIIFLLAI